MKIYLIGNQLVGSDNLPYTLLPALLEAFPEVEFEEADPNENFIPEDGSIILDTVEGLSEVKFFDSLDDFVTTRSVSPHDYDLGFHLQLLKKLHKIHSFTILGLPQGQESQILIDQVITELRKALARKLKLQR